MINKLEVFLNIYEKEYVVGTLAYKNRNIYFEYDKLFLTTGIEISPYKLPLKSGVMVCDDDLLGLTLHLTKYYR
jgi:serine/threonine-protein kinase HipA